MNEISYVLDKILEIVNENVENLKLTPDQYNADLSLLGMDSIKFITIVINLEQVFGIEIPDEYLLVTELGSINKMKSVVSYALEGGD
ncbi:MAG: hypothetical protein EWM47_00165 [Anaerolineaceae bacterium]|nr:MAG: hypothetical protein EWM47_00165 [Anaerolineaceae bacterium]